MKISVLVTFLFVLRISITRCHVYSAISCAVGRSTISLRDQQVATRLFDMHSKVRGAVKDYVFFYLYTKENPKGEEIFINDTATLKSSSFNSHRYTKIITHGYLASKDTSTSTTIRNAFLNTGDYNVIVVNWWPMQSLWGTIPIDYWRVASYVKEVGQYVSQLIDFLEEHGMDPKTTTLVGHSLGAHVMGIAGYSSRHTVNYIVGLDPASPSFDSRNASERLSIDDATIVEVIHTDEGNCGMSSPIGHYDFYPNGGSKQPGCRDNKCSHSRSCELYAESLANAFYGFKCSDFRAVKAGSCFGDVAVMGGYMKSSAANEGMFYLETSDSYPYAIGR